MRRARVKVEAGAGAERDLAYYIHDRVELLHQVFSILRSKEMRAMTPDSVRNLGTDDLQELCLEELLGISSKRLCAVLDGADPPSDTSSSDSENERLDTISLDSISSPDDLSIASNEKKEKRKCKRKLAKKNNADASAATANKAGNKDGGPSNSRAAERAGMTVLELLELQARARAIRAQLVLEQTKKATEPAANPSETEPTPGEVSDDSIEIKEEPQEIVELISSDEDEVKPEPTEKQTVPAETVTSPPRQSIVTKKNELTIIVPNKPAHRKIKLNRNNAVVSVINASDKPTEEVCSVNVAESMVNAKEIAEKSTDSVEKVAKNRLPVDKNDKSDKNKANEKKKAEKKKEVKQKKKKLKKVVNRKESHDGSDHDEITLQLSDSEKMDLLEDFDRTRYDNVSSSDDESSSEESESGDDKNDLAEKMNTTEISTSNSEEQSRVPLNASQTEIKNQTVHTNTDVTSQIYNNVENPLDKDTVCIPIVETQKENKIYEQIELEADEQTQSVNISDKSELDSINNVEKAINKKEDSHIVAMETENDTPESRIQLSNIEENTGSKIVITSIDDIPLLSEYYGPKNIESKRGTDNVEDDIKNDGGMERQATVKELLEESEKITRPEKEPLKNADASPKFSETTESETANSNEKVASTNIDGNKSSGDVKEVEKKQDEVPSENLQKMAKTDADRDMSDGELTDRSSSEVEMFDKPSEIVCISDDDDEVPKLKKKKTKTKKEKKSKKEKKAKKDKKSDFREAADHNFYDQTDSSDEENKPRNISKNSTEATKSDDSTKARSIKKDIKITEQQIEVIQDTEIIDLEIAKRVPQSDSTEFKKVEKCISSPEVSIKKDSENMDEILEISDDSSCYEFEGVNVLSKEPTSEEIEALSAKIDCEIEREEVVTEEQIRQHECENNICSGKQEDNTEVVDEMENLEDISWKDRWLDSSKVKKVLVTSNILNAVRKKNKELKKKLAESRKKVEVKPVELPKLAEVVKEAPIVEGSIEHFNMLQGSSQFVDPVKEPIPPEELIAAVKVAVQTATSETNGHVDTEPTSPRENLTKTIDNIENTTDVTSETKITDTLPVKASDDSAVTNTGEQATDIVAVAENGAENNTVGAENAELRIDLKKDAKQLLKMYKRLLKYNKMEKQVDLNKPKKKKIKKNKKSKESKNEVADIQ